MSPDRISTQLRLRVARVTDFRCGYCLTSQQIIGPLLEIDHILPRSRGGSDKEDNLVLACPLCNTHKSDKMEAVDPASGITSRLFNPRLDDWQDHFEWSDQGAIIRGKTQVGRATVVALNMNHEDVVAARRLWIFSGWHPPRS